MTDIDLVDDPPWMPRSPLRTLWLLGIVLTVASAAASVWAQYQWASRDGSSSSSSSSSSGVQAVNLTVAQVIEGVAPSTLTGGIVCVALALAVIAVRRDAALRVAGMVGARSAADPLDAELVSLASAPTVPEPVPAPVAVSQVLDIDSFKRPQNR